MRYYGVDGAAQIRFESHLKDRKQMKPIIAGVLHGSILGPLLLIIYINDISFASHFFNIIYTDDTMLDKKLKLL